MTKLVAALLSIILSIGTGILNLGAFGNAISELPFVRSFGISVAEYIRDSKAEAQQYPEESTFTKKLFADDTGDDFVSEPEFVIEAETWLSNELSFESEKAYNDPFNDVDVDLILVGNGVKYIIPGFWAGDNIWKIRFVVPSEGEWLFKTVCTDKSNSTLEGRTGKVICRKYDGEYDIYLHGFVTTSKNKKYLTYDDGTPFFYLGDTHWSLGDETAEMVDIICAKRASQGFTVIQSEPIGAKFNVENGITQADMAGFEDYDIKFQTVASYGLCHANAEFFYPYYIDPLIRGFGGYEADGSLSTGAKEYLEKASRYWVARYGSYPVMWTLGQEVDNDFYWREDNHPEWSYKNNPFILMAQYIEKYDAYSHPLTAHQENVGQTVAYGNGNGLDEKRTSYCSAQPSAFRSVSAHSWYAAQWTPSLTGASDYGVEKDYWYNSQGKPVVNYEGRYCYLWTKNFGSRMQGWAAYLSGMFGYGWGGHDTWSYLNTYDEENDSSDGVDTITSDEKINATWQDSLEYPSAYQVGYMKQFFTAFDWWKLIPRFDDRLYFLPKKNVYSFIASNEDNSKIVIYFYNFSDETVGASPNSSSGSKTGRVGALEPCAEYKYKWFDPSTGEYSEEKSFISTAFGTYEIGEKKFNGETVYKDMVIFIYK